MNRKNKIVYWIATLWLCLGMTSTGIVQLMGMKEEVATITGLGYPPYLLNILGVWKLAGVVVVLLPGLPLVKEWAYAGFFFAMSGAAVSHASAGGSIGDIWPSLLLLVLTALSWYFRPASRRLQYVKA